MISEGSSSSMLRSPIGCQWQAGGIYVVATGQLQNGDASEKSSETDAPSSGFAVIGTVERIETVTGDISQQKRSGPHPPDYAKSGARKPSSEHLVQGPISPGTSRPTRTWVIPLKPLEERATAPTTSTTTTSSSALPHIIPEATAQTAPGSEIRNNRPERRQAGDWSVIAGAIEEIEKGQQSSAPLTPRSHTASPPPSPTSPSPPLRPFTLPASGTSTSRKLLEQSFPQVDTTETGRSTSHLPNASQAHERAVAWTPSSTPNFLPERDRERKVKSQVGPMPLLERNPVDEPKLIFSFFIPAEIPEGQNEVRGILITFDQRLNHKPKVIRVPSRAAFFAQDKQGRVPLRAGKIGHTERSEEKAKDMTFLQVLEWDPAKVPGGG